MLDVPPVPNLTAEGLASKAVEIFRDFGFTDDQLEGMGWDGEYVKKNVRQVGRAACRGWYDQTRAVRLAHPGLGASPSAGTGDQRH